jgi:hypothetical protein
LSNLTVAREAIVTGNVKASSNLEVSSNLTVLQTATITGVLSTLSNLTVAKDAFITGNLAASNATFSNNLTVLKNTVITGGLDVTNSARLRSDLLIGTPGSPCYRLLVSNSKLVINYIDANSVESQYIDMSAIVDLLSNISVSK